jgi:hypothetical protein
MSKYDPKELEVLLVSHFPRFRECNSKEAVFYQERNPLFDMLPKTFVAGADLDLNTLDQTVISFMRMHLVTDTKVKEILSKKMIPWKNTEWSIYKWLMKCNFPEAKIQAFQQQLENPGIIFTRFDDPESIIKIGKTPHFASCLGGDTNTLYGQGIARMLKDANLCIYGQKDDKGNYTSRLMVNLFEGVHRITGEVRPIFYYASLYSNLSSKFTTSSDKYSFGGLMFSRQAFKDQFKGVNVGYFKNMSAFSYLDRNFLIYPSAMFFAYYSDARCAHAVQVTNGVQNIEVVSL